MHDNLIVVATDPSDPTPITLAQYHCTASQKVVITNNMVSPQSPYTGEPLKLVKNSNRISVNADEINNELVVAGTCECGTCLHVEAAVAQKIADASTKTPFTLHCVTCGSEVVANVDAQQISVVASYVDSLADANDPDDDGDDDSNSEGDDDDDYAGDYDYDDDGDDDEADDELVDPDEDDSDEDEDEEGPDAVASETEEKTDDSTETTETTDDKPATETPPATSTETPPVAPENSVPAELNVNAFEAFSRNLKDTDISLACVDDSTAFVVAHTPTGTVPFIEFSAKLATPDNAKLFAKPDNLGRAFAAVLASSNYNLEFDKLKPFGARQISFSLPVVSAIQDRINDGITAATASLAEDRTQLVNDMRQCLSIASVQTLKNLKTGSPNPMREPLIAALERQGTRDAGKLVDSVFASHGDELMKAVITSALELLEMPLAQRNVIANYVAEAAAMPTTKPTSVASDEANSVLAAGSMPVSTAATSHESTASSDNVTDIRNLVRNAANRSKRVAF